MFHFTHMRTLMMVLGAAVALGGLVATPALAQCNHFEPYTVFELDDPNGTYPEYVALDDLDGDGDLDMAVSCLRFDGQLRVAFNAGDATFPDYAVYAAGQNPESLAIGELDGQAGLDIVVANYGGEFASLYINDGTGVFTSSTITVGLGAYHVAIGDLDGDDDNDLAFVYPDYDKVAVFLNDGGGTFTAGDEYATYQGGDYSVPVSVAIGDMDGVNGNDMIVGLWWYGADQFLNDGTGTFTNNYISWYGSCNESVTIADVDGDGDNDIGLAHWWGGGAASVLLNNGDATYAGSMYGTGAWACAGTVRRPGRTGWPRVHRPQRGGQLGC